MDPYKGPSASPVPPPSTHDEFLEALIPSFMKLDVDGRVVRLDSFSKVLAPGSRVGWAVLPEQLAERMVRHNEVSVQNPAGFAQIILYKLLDEQWGHGGYLDWLIHIRAEYTSRRNVLLDACHKYLPEPVVSWTPPAAGMFVCTIGFLFCPFWPRTNPRHSFGCTLTEASTPSLGNARCTPSSRKSSRRLWKTKCWYHPAAGSAPTETLRSTNYSSEPHLLLPRYVNYFLIYLIQRYP